MKDLKVRKRRQPAARGKRRALDELPLDAGARVDRKLKRERRLASKERREAAREAKAKRLARKKAAGEKEGALTEFLGESFFESS